MMRRIALFSSLILASCALLTSAADEASTCEVSADCGCEQHCGAAADGSSRCLDGCEQDEDCSHAGLDARCSTAFLVCDRSSGRCLAKCSGSEIRCGDDCCFGSNPSCLPGGVCCPSGYSCGSDCCEAGEPFYRCEGDACVHN